MQPVPILSIWVGRAVDEAGPWIDAARRAGMEARTLPLIETLALPLKEEDLELLRDPREFTWVLFCSANAVRYAVDVRNGLRWPAGVSVGAVGPRTMQALQAAQLPVSLVSPEGTSASLAHSFLSRGFVAAITPVLLPVARSGRTELREMLEDAGHPVTVVPLYDTHAVAGPVPPKDEPVLLFSPSGADSYRKRVDDPEQHLVWAVGPTTAKAARTQGFHVAAVLNEPSPEALRRLIPS